MNGQMETEQTQLICLATAVPSGMNSSPVPSQEGRSREISSLTFPEARRRATGIYDGFWGKEGRLATAAGREGLSAK